MSRGIVTTVFTPLCDDEIDVDEFDVVFVIERRNDGWSYVRRVRGGVKGLVPTSYIRMVNLDSLLAVGLLTGPTKQYWLHVSISEPQLALRKTNMKAPIKAFKVQVEVVEDKAGIGEMASPPIACWTVWRTREQFYILYRNIHNLFNGKLPLFPVYQRPEDEDFHIKRLIPGSFPPMMIDDYDGIVQNSHGKLNLVQEGEKCVDDESEMTHMLQTYIDALLEQEPAEGLLHRCRWAISFFHLHNPLLLTITHNIGELEHLRDSRMMDINIADDNGRSCLHLATLLGYEDLVRFFINCGTLITSDAENKTPMEIAGSSGNDTILGILRKKYGVIDGVDYQALYLVERSKVAALEKKFEEATIRYQDEIKMLRSFLGRAKDNGSDDQRETSLPVGSAASGGGVSGSGNVSNVSTSGAERANPRKKPSRNPQSPIKRKGLKKRPMVRASSPHSTGGKPVIFSRRTHKRRVDESPVVPVAPRRDVLKEKQLEKFMDSVFSFDWQDPETKPGKYADAMWAQARPKQQMEQLGKLDGEGDDE